MAIVFIAVLVLALGYFLPNLEGSTDLTKAKSRMRAGGAFFVVIGIVVASFVTVPAGFRGILLQFGAVQGELTEGPHFIIPLIQSSELMEVRTQKEAADANAASKDLQNVVAKVAINYHVDPSAVGKLYKTVGRDFAQRIIDPATQETVKAVMANYTAEELINQRSKLKSEIDDALTKRLAAYDLIVEPGGVSLTNFDFSAEFNRAIEQKQVAQQTAEQQKYELQKAQLEAQTAIATAKGRAESAQLEAAAFNTLGGAKVLAKAWIEKWDGKLPTVTGGNNMILDLKSLIEQPNSAGSLSGIPPRPRGAPRP